MNNSIIPGILEQEWSEIEKKLAQVKTFTNTAHIDLIDGKFVNNQTFLDPAPFKKYASDLFLELHMMVEEPINFVEPFAAAGFRRFIGHIEKMSDQNAFIEQARKYGEAFLAIDSPTVVDAKALCKADGVLIMTTTAGFSGQAFSEESLSKIKELECDVGKPIEVDGGINDQTILLARDAGANHFIVTSYIFKSENPAEQYKKLTTLLG